MLPSDYNSIYKLGAQLNINYEKLNKLDDIVNDNNQKVYVYIINNNATVRQTAKAFGVSKSTVHKDVTDRLLQVNPTLATEARKVLDINKSERHIRGGLATKEKYLHLVHNH